MDKIHDDAKAKVNVSYVGKDENGKVIYKHKSHNVVCDLYYDLIADRISGGTDTLLTHGHAGTGSGQGATDTNLQTHCDEARTAVTSSTQGAGADLHKVTVIFTLGAGICTAQLEECGIFSNSAQATADMKVYDDTLSFNKTAGSTLEVTWVITHANA